MLNIGDLVIHKDMRKGKTHKGVIRRVVTADRYGVIRRVFTEKFLPIKESTLYEMEYKDDADNKNFLIDYHYNFKLDYKTIREQKINSILRGSEEKINKILNVQRRS